MKGTPEAPQCGFSMAISNTLRILGVNFKGVNVLENEELIAGYFIPESALLYHSGKVWAYFRENNEIFYKEEITNFYNIDNNKVFSTNSLLNLNIVVSGAQILLAEEFRSQIMQEDDD